MGCPRDRVNGQRIAGAGAPKCRRKRGVVVGVWMGGRVEAGRNGAGGAQKQSFKFEPITVCFCTVMNQAGGLWGGKQNQLRRGVLVKLERRWRSKNPSFFFLPFLTTSVRAHAHAHGQR